jgi:5'-nucleotidase
MLTDLVSEWLRRSAPALFAASLLTVVACGGNDDSVGAASTTSTTERIATRDALEILVTNDDGIAGVGLDALVEALRKEPDVKVTVVAPAGDRTGTGGSTTPGTLVNRPATTISGYEATAVEGFPADTVRVALDDLGLEPDLVMSGINLGQNLGHLTKVSGTVGAALAAGRRGIPALAVSQGLGSPPDYAAGVAQALAWLRRHRDSLTSGAPTAPVTNLNIPTCTTGEVRGVIEVRVATEEEGGQALAPSDCRSTAVDPDDDVEAFHNGFATLSDLPLS